MVIIARCCPLLPDVPSEEELLVLPAAVLAARLAEAYQLIAELTVQVTRLSARVEELERQARRDSSTSSRPPSSDSPYKKKGGDRSREWSFERHSDRVALGALGGFTVALGVTRDPRRASDLLLTGIPKAAALGREAFAAQLDRCLAAQGVITMDPAALRRLDRVDALVLEARVVRSGIWSIDEIVPFTSDTDLADCIFRARRMFNSKDPTSAPRRGAWTLAPLTEAHPLPARREASRPAHRRRRPSRSRPVAGRGPPRLRGCL